MTTASLKATYVSTHGVGLGFEKLEVNFTEVSLLYQHHTRLSYLDFDKINHSLVIFELDKKLTNVESSRRGDVKILHEQEKGITEI